MKINELTETLRRHGINTQKFGKGKAKTLEELLEEINTGESTLSVSTTGQLERHLRTLAINVKYRDARGRVLVLHEASRKSHDGRDLNRKTQHSVTEKLHADEKAGHSSLERALREELGITDPKSYKITNQQAPKIVTRKSDSYPGLLTKNELHEFTVWLDKMVFKPQYAEDDGRKITTFEWKKENTIWRPGCALIVGLGITAGIIGPTWWSAHQELEKAQRLELDQMTALTVDEIKQVRAELLTELNTNTKISPEQKAFLEDYLNDDRVFIFSKSNPSDAKYFYKKNILNFAEGLDLLIKEIGLKKEIDFKKMIPDIDDPEYMKRGAVFFRLFETLNLYNFAKQNQLLNPEQEQEIEEIIRNSTMNDYLDSLHEIEKIIYEQNQKNLSTEELSELRIKYLESRPDSDPVKQMFGPMESIFRK